MTDLTNDELDNIERSINAPQPVAPSESETRRMLIELRRVRTIPLDLRRAASVPPNALYQEHVRGAVIRSIAQHVPDGSLGLVMRSRIAETVVDTLMAAPSTQKCEGPIESDRLTDAELDSIERSLGGSQQVATSRSETCRMLMELRRTRGLLATPVAAFIRELEVHRVMRKKLEAYYSFIHFGDDHDFAANLRQYLQDTK